MMTCSGGFFRSVEASEPFGPALLLDDGGAVIRLVALPDGRSVIVEDSDGVVVIATTVSGRLVRCEEYPLPSEVLIGDDE